MRHRHSKTLFNQPVNPEKLGLPDYFEIVKQPQDFGSILTRLHGSLERGSKSRSYRSAEEVHKEVLLVFDNCKAYNRREQDSVTRTAAAEVQGIFEEKWAAAGLKGLNNTPSQPSSEAPSAEASRIPSTEAVLDEAVAPIFSVQGLEDADLPVCFLDEFSIYEAGVPAHPLPLEGWVKGQEQLVLKGTLIADPSSTQLQGEEPDDDAHVADIVVTDWCFSYGDAPSVWVITCIAWFKLLDAAPEYADIHTLLLRKLDLCSAAVHSLRSHEGVHPADAAAHAVASQSDSLAEAAELADDAAFIESQLHAWLKANGLPPRKKLSKAKLRGLEAQQSKPRKSGKMRRMSAMTEDGGKASRKRQLDDAGGEGGSKRARTSTTPDDSEDASADEEDEYEDEGEPSSARRRLKALSALQGMDEEEAGVEDGSRTSRKRKKKNKLRQSVADLDAGGRVGKKGSTSTPGGKRKGGRLQDVDGAPGSPLSGNEGFSHLAPAERKKAILAARRVRYHQLKAEEAERLRKAKVMENRAKLRKEREADEARGPPPPPCRDFRLPAYLLPDVLMTWELLQALGHMFKLPPFPFARLEAAVLPGPHSFESSEPAVASNEPSQELLPKPEEPLKELQPREEPGRQQIGPTEPATPAENSEKPEGKEIQAPEKPTPKPVGKKKGKRQATRKPSSRKSKAADNQAAATDDAASPAAEEAAARAAREAAEAAAEEAQKAKAAAEAKHAEACKAASLRAKLGQGSGSEPLAAVDEAADASAVLLRDVHCALLLAMGTGKGLGAADARQPGSATISSPEEHSPSPWTLRVSQAVLAAPLDVAPDDAKEAAVKLLHMEYLDLGVEQRVALLAALTSMALTCEPIRDYISAQAEALAAPSRKGRPEGKDGDGKENLDGDGGSDHPKTVQLLPPGPPLELGSVEAWKEWRRACRVGIRRSLGYDFHRRRYWAMGGAAAAWRVYVEEDEGRHWGWYDGQSISSLVDWLWAGSIEREGLLLRALAQIPLPRQPLPEAPPADASQEPSKEPQAEQAEQAEASKANAEPGNAAGPSPAAAPAGPVVSDEELQARRPDGLRGLAAPLLRGDGNWPSLGLYTSPEARILQGVESLLASVPFWAQGHGWMSRQIWIVDALASPVVSKPGEVGKVLLEVESMLDDASCLSQEWGHMWRSPWRDLVTGCTSLRDSLLYLAALQEHMKRDYEIMPRNNFSRVARDMQCQLWFPLPSENVVLLRSGLLKHLDQHAAVFFPSPAAPVPTDPTAVTASHSAPIAAATAPNDSFLDHVEHSEAAAELDVADSVVADASTAAAISAAAEAATEPSQPVQKTHLPRKRDVVMSEAAEPMDTSQAGVKSHDQKEIPMPAPGVIPSDNGDANKSQASQPPSDNNTKPVEQEAQKPRLQPHAGAFRDADAVMASAGETGADAQQLDQAEQEVPLTADAQALKQHWGQLKGQVNALRPVERFQVVSIAYRRGFLRGDEEEEAASLRLGIVPRMPVAWLLLKPVRARPSDPLIPLAVPIAADSSLPDYVVRADIYDKGMQRIWGQSDRFRMFFGSKTGQRGGGQYYKGEVVKVRQKQPSPGATLAEHEAYDPWEALDVEWEMGGALEAEEGGCLRVSPWEIEGDPETEARRLEELRKQEEASARTARALAKSRRLHDDGDDDGGSPFDRHHPGFHAGDGSMPGPEVMPDGSLRYLSQPPILKAGQVPQAVLDHLRDLSKEQLKNLLVNWYRRAKGKYKVPVFAHQELDLHKVFWEVQDRGGYDHVTAHKLWKDVCRCLEVDLTGQTSASYNMRLNYEKCLLEFESYLASGQFAAELAAGSAPTHQSLGHSFAKPAMIVGAGVPSSSAGPSRLGQPQTAAAAVFTPFDSASAPNAPSPGRAEAPDAGLSFTELLTMDGDALTPAQPNAPPTATAHSSFDPYAFPVPGGVVSQGRSSRRGVPLSEPPSVLPAPLPYQTTTFGHGPNASWLKLVPPPATPGSHPVQQPRQAAPVVMLQPLGCGSHGSMAATSLGHRLQARGVSIVGCKVQRFWPVREGTDGDGSWWDAHISEYQTRKTRHRLVYDLGTPEESFEFVDFRELADDEIRQHPAFPIFPPPSAEAPMVSIAAALQTGISPSELHRMVDNAADSIANMPRPRSPPPNPDWPALDATSALPPPLLQPSHPRTSHPLQGLVNAANCLGMASSMPTSHNPQQQSLPLPDSLPHMYPAASGTYDNSTAGMLQDTPLLPPTLNGIANPADSNALIGEALLPIADPAAAVGMRVRSESSADQHEGDPIAMSISPAAAPHINESSSAALGQAPVAPQNSQPATEVLPDFTNVGNGEPGPDVLGRQSETQHLPAAAAAKAGPGMLLDAQPLRRKRSKRVKVEVPRDPIGDDASGTLGDTPKARNENGHSYRNGSLKILLRSPSAAPLQRPSSAASTRAESPAANEPQASEDMPAGEAGDSQRASLRIRLRGTGPRKRYGDESPTQGRHTPWSKMSQAQNLEPPPSQQRRHGNRDSASPSTSSLPVNGGVKSDGPDQLDDGAQSGRPKQTRLRVKPLALND
ncbi:hypothetical protein WJX74_005940 [Apatococcus lobatus]|uniref:Uncharacterized protein n=1 Tax=Apatococcus lobatus TaxID=904363 RepID=A0AAW1RHG5_9CHLO